MSRCCCNDPLPEGEARGQLLQWDTVTSAWIVTPPPAEEGQIVEWNGTLWVPTAQTLGIHTFGSVGLANIVSQFFGPEVGTTGQASRALSGEYSFPFDCRIDLFGANHSNVAAGSPNPVTYFLHVGGVDTALSVSGNTNAAGPFTDLVNSVDYTAFTRFCVRGNWPTMLGQQIRPDFTMRLRARTVSP